MLGTAGNFDISHNPTIKPGITLVTATVEIGIKNPNNKGSRTLSYVIVCHFEIRFFVTHESPVLKSVIFHIYSE